MTHRIHNAMRSGALAPMGGNGGEKGGGGAHEHAVLALVERGGEMRCGHVEDMKAKTVVLTVKANVEREARIMTDDAGQYRDKLGDFQQHDVVAHSAGEYMGDDIHTKHVENHFLIFKRGMKDVHQHRSE